MLRRLIRHGLEAINRGDYEACFSSYHPNSETFAPATFAVLGFDPVYRGREGRIRLHRQWVAELGEFRNEPEELTDLGDGRVLVVGRVEGSGGSSGVAFGNEAAYLLTVSAGRVMREQMFTSRADALDAAGLSE